MIILYDCIFGMKKMIIFQLIEWIATNKERLKAAKRIERYRHAFPVPAIPTRHDITCLSAARKIMESCAGATEMHKT